MTVASSFFLTLLIVTKLTSFSPHLRYSEEPLGGSNYREPQNHLGGLLAQVVLGPTPGFLTQQFRHGARVRIPNELPGDAVTAALGPTAGRAAGPHHHRWSKG